MVQGKVIKETKPKRSLVIMLLPCCVTSGRSLNFSEPEASRVKWRRLYLPKKMKQIVAQCLAW